MWSVGIVFFILLTGKAPYDANEEEKIIKEVEKARINYKLIKEAKISKEATQFL